MPTYDYVCDGCGHEFELFQTITAPVERKCPGCKKRKLRRLFGTGAAVMFKGSGFYQTDYRSESYKKAADADRKSSSDAKDSSKDKSSSEGAGSAEAKAASDGKAAPQDKSSDTKAAHANTKKKRSDQGKKSRRE